MPEQREVLDGGGFWWLASVALLPTQATQNRWRSSTCCVHLFFF